ncbi:alpha/beta fold hydrolase [Kitasatospora viridis]|uniref:Pimeloyl-ACP methyl ester carboxylesterase n=1 Tax=Kitasatospora viridis TaxID=281105 RepID=A0A561UB46_9ACTN|nr:alpha/beta hydrolase [Kitasatospora viridis]TWF96592.1 pimeloyl-ACP methyl ester carboxylesterase [Kitasatospora viridis]
MSHYELPQPAERRRIRSADGHWINVEAYGPEDAPPVLLAHGWTCSTRFWAPVIHRLAADHRLIAYDQRGHGRSDIPPTPRGYSTTALADDLEAVLTAAVPAGRRAVLVGHSMGGMTIMAAGDRPAVAERTAAALLCSTGPAHLVERLRVLPAAVPAGPRRFLHRRILLSRLPMGPITRVSKAVLKQAVMGSASTPEQVRATAETVFACPTAVRARWARVLGELDVRDGLERLAAPTAVLVGEQDKLTPPPHADAMIAALPNPDGLLRLPGTGHMSPAERPAEVAAEIRRLVTRHLATERTDAA